VVFFCEEDSAVIADLVGQNDPALLQSLVGAAALQLRSASIKTLSFPLLQGSSWIPLMRRIGFCLRESSPVITYSGGVDTNLVSDKWLLLAGDRES
jgi:hypothetical protein